MAEKKDKYLEEYEKLQNEIIRDRVKEAFAKDPANYKESLSEIGFTWHDDDYPSEEDEESAAVPENERQRLLVAYFEGKTDLSSTTSLEALLAEQNSPDSRVGSDHRFMADIAFITATSATAGDVNEAHEDV